MTRARLIENYRDMMYDFGEYDVWEDDIEPKLEKMTDKQILKMYEDDLAWYEYRDKMMQV